MTTWGKDCDYQIVGVLVYPHGTRVVQYRPRPLLETPPENVQRGKIYELSYKSRSRLTMILNETTASFGSMMTLTYSDYSAPVDGVECKENLGQMLDCIRCKTWYKASPYYLWFLEFTKRGRVHIHVLLGVDAITPAMRDVVAHKWVVISGQNQRMCELRDSGDYDKYLRQALSIFKVHYYPAAWEIARERAGIKRYAIKYATKTAQKIVPKDFQNIGRFWGCSQSVAKLPEPELLMCTGDDLREMLVKEGNKRSSWTVLPKIIYPNRSPDPPMM